MLQASRGAAPFSSSSTQQANRDPATDLQDLVMPQRVRRPEPGSPVSPRDPELPTDGNNPMMQGYPLPDKRGTMTTSTATPDTTTPERGSRLQQNANTQSEQNRTIQGTGPPTQKPRSANEGIRDLFRKREPGGQRGQMRGPLPTRNSMMSRASPTSDFRAGADAADALAGRGRTSQVAQRQQAEANAKKTQTALERQMTRQWRAGDVYSPHDLSPAEQMKARTARQANSRFRLQTRARSRQHGGADAFDVLRLNPVKEYKNYTMMGEFVTEAGRIRGARETGLRAVNQRKLAKAVRRSIGMGLIPSVHRHPELYPEREQQREAVWRRNLNSVRR